MSSFQATVNIWSSTNAESNGFGSFQITENGAIFFGGVLKQQPAQQDPSGKTALVVTISPSSPTKVELLTTQYQ